MFDTIFLTFQGISFGESLWSVFHDIVKSKILNYFDFFFSFCNKAICSFLHVANVIIVTCLLFDPAGLSLISETIYIKYLPVSLIGLPGSRTNYPAHGEGGGSGC